MSGVLNVVIALVLIYLIFSIVVSGLQEWWAQFLGHRGTFLRLGMQRLIRDDAIFVRVLQHPLVGNLYRDRAARGKPPSYIEPGNFALAFADVVLRRAATPDDGDDAQRIAPTTLDYESLHRAVSRLRLQHSSAALAVLPILEQAQGDLPKALQGIEAWFNHGMDRVSGWYKGYSQRRLFVWGLVVAGLCNVDSIAIFHALDRSPDLASRLSVVARNVVDSGLGGVDVTVLKQRELTADESRALVQAVLKEPIPSLPIGYGCLGALSTTDAEVNVAGAPSTSSLKSGWQRCGAELDRRWKAETVGSFLLHLLGWTMTALAGVLGAPYWFGLLSKVVNIRGAGPRPEDRR